MSKGTKFVLEGEREALTPERAEKLLANLPGDATFVKLSGKSFGDGSAAVVGEKLASAAASLRTLDLSDIIASRPEDEAKRALATIADALSDCTGLLSLDLSDNALGAKGVRAVSSLVSAQTALESVKFCNNGLSGDACALIAESLSAAVETLRTIHFHNNLSENAGAVALAPFVERCAALEDFRFSSLRVGRAGCVRICEALAPAAERGLRVLNVSDNSFGPEGAAALATTLADATALEELAIRDCLLGDKGCLLAIEAVAASGLREVDISGNECGKRTAKGVQALFEKCKKIERFAAEDNEFGNQGAVMIAEAIEVAGGLKTVNLNSCEIGGRGAKAVADAAAGCDSIQKVHLNGNTIPAHVVESIQQGLSERLGELSDNDESGEDEDGDEEEEEDTDW